MRSQFMRRFIGYLASFLITTTSFSQVKNVEDLPPVVISGTGFNKYVNDKAERAFKKLFTDAENPIWYYANNNYLVQFQIGGQDNSALFSRRGILIYHISYSKEKHLPADLRRMVKSNYVDCSIPQAARIEQYGRTVWVVYIEDDANLYQLKLEDGGLEEIAHYQKQQNTPLIIAKKQ